MPSSKMACQSSRIWHSFLEENDYYIHMFLLHLGKGPSINDVSSEREGGGPPSKPMKGDENRYLVLSKADVVLDPSKCYESQQKYVLFFQQS